MTPLHLLPAPKPKKIHRLKQLSKANRILRRHYRSLRLR